MTWVGAILAGACQLVQETAASERAVLVGQEFLLAPAEAVHVSTMAGSSARFRRVVSDRRCPRQLTCAISGPVTVEVEIQAPSEPKRVAQLAVFDRAVGGPKMQGVSSCAASGKLALKLRDVQPWPMGHAPVAPETYRASFVFSGSCVDSR